MSAEDTTATLTVDRNIGTVEVCDLLWLDEVIAEYFAFDFDCRFDSVALPFVLQD